MLKIIQQIIGLAIVVFGFRLWHRGSMGLRVPLAVIVVGVLVMLNTTRKKKAEEEEDDDW